MVDDPYLDRTIQSIRGFDLGDDEPLLAHFDQQTDPLDVDDVLFHAVLLFRAGRTTEALRVLDDERCTSDSARLLRAWLVEPEAGVEILDSLLESMGTRSTDNANAAEREHGLLLHSRGNLLAAAGRHNEAIDAFQAGLRRDTDEDGQRWWQIARSHHALGDLEAALAAAANAVDAEHSPDDARHVRYEYAAWVAEQGDPHRTADLLKDTDGYFHRPGELAERIADDARFDRVREHPAVRPYATVPDLSWLDELPDWFAALRRDPRIAEYAITWLGRTESRQATETVRNGYEEDRSFGEDVPEELLELYREKAGSLVAVGYGPSIQTFHAMEDPAYWFIDPDRPDGLFLALSNDYNPYLWIHTGTTVDGALEVLRHFFPSQRADRTDLTKEYRAYIGNRNEIGDIHDIERAFTFVRFLDYCTWCSGHIDNPWPGVIPPQRAGLMKISGFSRRTAHRHDPQRLWSESWPTVHSRSYFTIEVHQQDYFVLAVRYRPSPFASVIEQHNELHGCRLPTDLPPDVAGAMQSLEWADLVDIEADLATETDPSTISALIRMYAALGSEDLERIAKLREWAHHPAPEVRAAIWNAALQYNLVFLVDELLLAGVDGPMADRCLAVLNLGGFPLHTRHRDAFPDQEGTERYEYDDDDEEEDDVDPEDEEDA